MPLRITVRSLWTALVLFALSGGAAIRAEVSISSLSPSESSPQPVGTSITFTATAADQETGDLRYRFRVRPAGGAYETVIDYGVSNSFVWLPAQSEGMYDIEVSVRNRATGSTAALETSFVATPRATRAPVVSSTTHPMVAFYSAPACPAGSTMRVYFKRAFDGIWRSTNAKACNGTSTMNFLVAGMLANSFYILRGETTAGEQVTTLPDAYFSVPGVEAPVVAVQTLLSLDPGDSYVEGLTLIGTLAGRTFAVDSFANVLWYYPGDLPKTIYTVRALPDGNQLAVFYNAPEDLARSGFREYNLAGATVKETTAERLSEQLIALGKHPITAVHHDIRRLANGNYLMLGLVELITDDQGPNTDVLGDMILVLDNNLQVLWTWDSFEHLDVTRKAVLGETCTNGLGGCVVLKAPIANDWTHGNALSLMTDGNILYNSRHQDLAYKIAFANGTGDGSVIWKLGKDGDFTWKSNDPYPWFSHAHNLDYNGTPDTISLFDNGNTRVAQNGGNSRGQVLHIDETNRTVTPLVNADLGVFSAAVGSAQILSNGNLVFDAGLLPPALSRTIETSPTGSIVSVLQVNSFVYRTFRMPDLYSASAP